LTEAIIHWLTELIFRLSYLGIALLMALESSFIPFPSEVVLPPAGYLAAQGRMSAPLAVAAGLAGSLIGALINYFLAARLGRPLLHKYGRRLLIKEASLDRAERFFQRHGEISMFVGRLIPVIRQLISLPGGFARMRIDRFVLYTAAGAGIWCAILTYIGWYVGRHAEVFASFDELIESPVFREYSTRAAIALFPLILLLVVVYVVVQRRRRSNTSQRPAKQVDGAATVTGAGQGAKWLISGRVQGVGFRWFVVRQAEQLGIRGWARNLSDGRVEVVAAGDPTALQRLEVALAEGPRISHVDSVESADFPQEVMDLKSFEIR
jgi:membrane protein DedA with SNARE-associated domain/acylphosphatase